VAFQRRAEGLQFVSEADVPGSVGGAIRLAEKELVLGGRGVFQVSTSKTASHVKGLWISPWPAPRTGLKD